jgi:hypothetical protein
LSGLLAGGRFAMAEKRLFGRSLFEAFKKAPRKFGGAFLFYFPIFIFIS